MPLASRDVSVDVRNADGSLGRQRGRSGAPISAKSSQGPHADLRREVPAARCLPILRGFYLLSKARTLAEWQAALRLTSFPRQFHIRRRRREHLYQWNARVPVRRMTLTTVWTFRLRARGRMVAPASRGRCHAAEPAWGYIQNANTSPFVSLRNPATCLSSRDFERGSLALRPQLALEIS